MKGWSSYNSLVVAALALASCDTNNSIDVKDETSPNIVMFLVDDLGWQDTSVPFWYKKTHFNKLYETPAMERLAQEGVKFTNAYAASVCSPTRVSILTGKNPARHRVTNWTLFENESTDRSVENIDLPQWNVNSLQPVGSDIDFSVEANTLPQLLREEGYFTIHTGKAHMGAIGTPGEDPCSLGFDINIAGHGGGGLWSYYGMQFFGNAEKGEHTLPMGIPGMEHYHGKDIFLTEALTRDALDAVDFAVDKEKPFFLHMSHYAVHDPIQPDSRFIDKYTQKGICDIEAAYATMIEGVDKSLDDILNHLDKLEVSENTIIIFYSDNGGLSAYGRGGEPHIHNLPLRSGKGSIYEGGIRVPMIVKWPGVTSGGGISSQFVNAEDFYPSILEMAGVSFNNVVQEIDGESFVTSLNGCNSSSNRSLVWHYPNRWGAQGPGIGTYSAIRKGDWKLIYWYCTGEFELYNLKTDIGEQIDYSVAKAKKAKELSIKLSEFLRDVNAQRPFIKGTDTLVPWPNEAI
ncbi:sulfatase [Marinilabiliaceae bacterium ANBcel2]|nr:sulfatase [Marinilabiliaceae bacterium ANBcel2]